MLSRELASGETGSYRIVFMPEEPRIRVEFAPAGRSWADAEWILIDDFINFIPVGETHQRARDSLVALLEQMLR